MAKHLSLWNLTKVRFIAHELNLSFVEQDSIISTPALELNSHCVMMSTEEYCRYSDSFGKK